MSLADDLRDAKPTISVDFDKPINPYSRGWDAGNISDLHPQIGARGALEQLNERFRLIIHTARTDHDNVREALDRWELGQYFEYVGNVKQPAVAYVDDRAVRWVSWNQTMAELEKILYVKF